MWLHVTLFYTVTGFSGHVLQKILFDGRSTKGETVLEVLISHVNTA